jgi:ATP-dependent Clp protease protease subunit
VNGTVQIFGQIGGESTVDENGLFHPSVNLIDVVEQAGGIEGDEINVEINSPGGFVDVGDAIYNYLVSLKAKGKKINTIQKGLVGSIATKIFLAGDNRMVDDRYKFFIHNPLIDQKVTGDQDVVRAIADDLAKTEEDLKSFYGQFTGITTEGLDALMKQETSLTADQAIKFKFATGKVKTPVFNSIKKMSTPKAQVQVKDEKSFFALAKAFFAPETQPKGIQPKAAVPVNTEPNNLTVNLADGAGSFYVQGEAIAEGVGAFLLDETGAPTNQPLADGAYVSDAGVKMEVKAGKVVKAEFPEDKPEDELPKEEEEMMTKTAAEAMVKAAVEEALKGVKSETESVKAEVLALKKGAKLGVQPKAAVFGNPSTAKVRSITQVMKQKQEERTKKLNSNNN